MKKHEKYNTVKQFACLLLACLLLLPAAAFAEGGGEVAGQLPLAAEPDSGIIDSDALNSWMDGFLKEHRIPGIWPVIPGMVRKQSKAMSLEVILWRLQRMVRLFSQTGMLFRNCISKKLGLIPTEKALQGRHLT